MDENEQSLLSRFGFSEAWLDLGIVTLDELPQVLRDFESSDDSNTEHIRWRKFVHFLEVHPNLTAEIAHRLYALGDSDSDPSMGGSMMVTIVKRRDCPAQLLDLAARSDRKYVRKAAQEALSRRSG